MWGARSLGPPSGPGRAVRRLAVNAMDFAIAPLAPAGRFEFRVGDEVASLVDGEVVDGPIDDPDVVVEGDAEGIYSLFVDRCLDRVTIRGDQALLDALLEAAPPRFEAPATT